MPSKCLSALLIGLSLGAQVPDLASLLARRTSPALLILAPAEPGKAKPLTARELLETDGLEEVGLLSALADAKNPRSLDINRAYRAHLGLPEACWALIAPGGGDRGLQRPVP